MMRIFQSPCRTSTNKPVKITLNAMQLAKAIIAGLKSDATAAVCTACRALWIKKAIVAKYETIIASTSRNRRAPDLLAVTRNGTASAVFRKPSCISSSASHIFAMKPLHARQRLVQPSNAFSR
jgi:hypothetical protein